MVFNKDRFLIGHLTKIEVNKMTKQEVIRLKELKAQFRKVSSELLINNILFMESLIPLNRKDGLELVAMSEVLTEKS